MTTGSAGEIVWVRVFRCRKCATHSIRQLDGYEGRCPTCRRDLVGEPFEYSRLNADDDLALV